MTTLESPKNLRGFPSFEAEKNLFDGFSKSYLPQIPDLVRYQVPDWQPTNNQLQVLMGFLYGFYFYDYISGGSIISGEAGNLAECQKYRRNKGLPYHQLTWPLSLEIEGKTPSASLEKGFVIYPVGIIADADPYQLVRSKFHTLSRKNSSVSYLSFRFLEVGLFTGLEECSHLHVRHLEKTNYANLDHTYKILGPLKDYSSGLRSYLADVLNINLLDYNALNGYEFASHIVQMQYLKRYLPDLWENNYDIYDQAIRHLRHKHKSH